MDKTKGFTCDKPIKEKVLRYYKTKAEEKGFVFIEDIKNNNNPFARIDLMFAVSSNTIFQNYAIEIKQRTNNEDAYKDIMFEEEKMEELKQLEKQGYKAYFLNVFKNDSALQYDTKVKYQTGISHQHKYTVEPNDAKQQIIKIYLPKSGTGIKWINISQ